MERVSARRSVSERRGRRRESGGELPAEHAILGLLVLEADQDDGSSYGYDLARHFAPGQPLAEIIRLEAGMLYHHLKKLARVGWASVTVEPQGSRPPRQNYRITSAGRRELERWLQEPVTRTRELRLEFLVKLYFARLLDPDRAERLVREQHTTVTGLLSSIEQQLTAIDQEEVPEAESDPAHDFRRQVLTLRLAQTQAAVDWLRNLER